MRTSNFIHARLALMALLLIFTIGAGAQDASTQFGDFVFTVPNGWNPVEKGDAMFLTAPAPRPGASIYIALAANDLSGSLQTSFNGLWMDFQKSYRVLQGGQIMPLHLATGYEGYTTIAVAIGRDGGQWNVCLAGIQYGKRIEAVTFWSNLPFISIGPYVARFKAFLDALTFADSSTMQIPPADPPSSSEDTPHQLPAGMLQGVYVCTGGANGMPTNKQYLFYPDGLIRNGVPENGMLGFDFDHYRSESNRDRDWVGRYRVDGDKVSIVWQNQFGDPLHPALIKINDKSPHPAWDAGWDTFIPMCRCTGKTFSGKYVWNLPAADQYIQFFADGTFLDHRALDQLIVPSAFYEHPRIQRGRYSIQSQTMVFVFADGHHATHTFVAPKVEEDQPTFDWIELGRQQLFEENYRAMLQKGQ